MLNSIYCVLCFHVLEKMVSWSVCGRTQDYQAGAKVISEVAQCSDGPRNCTLD